MGSMVITDFLPGHDPTLQVKVDLRQLWAAQSMLPGPHRCSNSQMATPALYRCCGSHRSHLKALTAGGGNDLQHFWGTSSSSEGFPPALGHNWVQSWVLSSAQVQIDPSCALEGYLPPGKGMIVLLSRGDLRNCTMQRQQGEE